MQKKPKPRTRVLPPIRGHDSTVVSSSIASEITGAKPARRCNMYPSHLPVLGVLASEGVAFSELLRHRGLMWAFISAGPYPRGFKFTSKSRSPMKPRAAQGSVYASVTTYLRTHAGQEFTPTEITLATGLRPGVVNTWLQSNTNRGGGTCLEQGVILRVRKGIYTYGAAASFKL